MNVIKPFYFLMIFLAVCFACQKQPGVPTMTMTASITHPVPSAWRVYFYLSGTGSVTIDWGDTYSETRTLNAFNENDWMNSENEYYHVYSTPSTYTIRIEGDNITHLVCFDNDLTSLKIRENIRLESLHCISNKITSLDVSKNTNIKYLDCQNNKLTSLDVSKNPLLTSFFCQYNQIKELDVRENMMLTFFNCGYNQLTSLDVSQNTKLTQLECYFNQLTSLDVSKNILLSTLSCSSNKLTNLDVSKNSALWWMDCAYNQLTSLDFSANTKLYFLYCQDNLLTADELDALFRTLNSIVKWEGGYGDKRIVIDPNPGADACNRSIATDKEWVFFQPENYITANPTAPENDAGRDDGGLPFSNWTPSAPMKSSGL